MLIGEIIAYRQPLVWAYLQRRYLAYLGDWERLMREKPEGGGVLFAGN